MKFLCEKQKYIYIIKKYINKSDRLKKIFNINITIE